MPSRTLLEVDEQRRSVTSNAAVALDATVAARAIERAIGSPDSVFSRRAILATRSVLTLVDSLSDLQSEDLKSVVEGASHLTMKLPPATNVARAASRTQDRRSSEELVSHIRELVAESRTIECVGSTVRVSDASSAKRFVEFLREVSSGSVSQALAADSTRFSAYAVG